jgi:hypothetical protein
MTSSNCFSITETTSALAIAASGLSAGQHTDITPNTLQDNDDIQWIVRNVWYDEARKELQYMGKPVGATTDFAHSRYVELEDQWYYTPNVIVDSFGHSWMNAFDPVNGDYYFTPYSTGATALNWYDRSDGASGTWKTTVTQANLGSGNTPRPGPGYHPNLFGAGNPGIFHWSIFRFYSLNLTTPAWTDNGTVGASGTAFYNRSSGVGVYMPGSDELLMWAGPRNDSGSKGIAIAAGAGSETALLTAGAFNELPEPPVNINGSGGTTPKGHPINHPNNPDRLLLLEEQSGSRVWESTDYGRSWSLLDGWTHPFGTLTSTTSGTFTCGEIRPYGVVVGISSHSSGGTVRLWRPNS